LRDFRHFWHLITLGFQKAALPSKGAAKVNPTGERPWLEVLKNVEEIKTKEGKKRTNTVLSTVEVIPNLNLSGSDGGSNL